MLARLSLKLLTEGSMKYTNLTDKRELPLLKTRMDLAEIGKLGNHTHHHKDNCGIAERAVHMSGIQEPVRIPVEHKPQQAHGQHYGDPGDESPGLTPDVPIHFLEKKSTCKQPATC